jgi:hypothetical protein
VGSLNATVTLRFGWPPAWVVDGVTAKPLTVAAASADVVLEKTAIERTDDRRRARMISNLRCRHVHRRNCSAGLK